MQDKALESLVLLISSILEKNSKKVLFLITQSDKEEQILLGELHRLLRSYPGSHICMDIDAEEIYPRIKSDSECAKNLLKSREDIKQEVLLADEIAAVSFDLSTLNKVARGLNDSNITFAIMEAFLHGKTVIASEDNLMSKLMQCSAAYRKLFEEAKVRTEKFGMIYCSLHQIKLKLDNFSLDDLINEKEAGKRESGKKQIVTTQDLMNEDQLVIDDDAIITPAAKELLIAKNNKR